MLTNVYLSGQLAKKYGECHKFDINSIQQAVSALCSNFKEFYQDFSKYDFHVKVGNQNIGEDELTLNFNKKKSIRFIPVLKGSKRSGALKVIAGVTILTAATLGAAAIAGPLSAGFSSTAFSVFGANITYGSLALTGLAITLQGFSSLLTPLPKANYGSREKTDQRASFLFNGPTNRTAEGATIPLVYGKFRVGSVVISSGLRVEQV